MFGLLPLLAVPLAVMLIFKLTQGKSFTAKEFLALEGGMVIILCAGFGMARYGAMTDTEVWNGRISDKAHYDRSCSHSYDCMCVCVSHDENGSCTSEVCQTCYDHNRDYFWDLSVNTGDKLQIESCGDCKNRSVPIWENAYVGEPASVTRRYQNYLKADPESILRMTADGIEGAVPGYPGIHSRYKINRVINQGTQVPTEKLNSALNEVASDLGSGKQVNIVAILTTNPDPRFADKVEVEWLYGKKNDLVFVVGAPDGKTVKWARVVTISDVEMLKIRARDEMPGMELTDVEGISEYLQDLILTDFQRTSMAEFEYLASAAKPSTAMLVFLYILALLGSIGGSIFMTKEDPFGDERRSWRR